MLPRTLVRQSRLKDKTRIPQVHDVVGRHKILLQSARWDLAGTNNIHWFLRTVLARTSGSSIATTFRPALSTANEEVTNSYD